MRKPTDKAGGKREKGVPTLLLHDRSPAFTRLTEQNQFSKKMHDIELILGNSNSRFSGVTSTMLQVLHYQKNILKVVVMGKHHLPERVPCLSFFQTAKLCKKPLADGRYRLFHARRNDEVIQALLLKFIFRAKIRIAFTATSQRDHSWITRFLIRQCDAVITTCSAANQYIAGGADTVIPHGIDTETYSPATHRGDLWQELGFPGKYGIGVFGRVRHQKGIDLLIKAAIPLLKKHPDFTVIICGKIMPKDEAYVTELQEKIDQHELADRFLFLGEQPFSEVPKIMRAMSIIAALSRNEGYGLTIPEAMASGTAVLASEAGAWKDVVRDGADGYVVRCDDLTATSEKLELLMSDIPALTTMGQRGRERIESHYKIEDEANHLCKFLTSLQ